MHITKTVIAINLIIVAIALVVALAGPTDNEVSKFKIFGKTLFQEYMIISIVSSIVGFIWLIWWLLTS